MVIGQFAQSSKGTYNRYDARPREWVGRVVSGLVIAFLLVDAIPKLLRFDFAVNATTELGYPDSRVAWIGLTLLICTVLYALPRTAILGAVLLTGYLGGATAIQVQLDDPAFLIFPVAFGVLVWAGLHLRNPQVRALVS